MNTIKTAGGPSIAVVGESLIDIVRDPTGGSTEHVGGSPLNVAAGLGRLGHHVHLATALGDNARGRRIRDHLAASGVIVAEGSTSSGATSTAIATVGANGAASYEFDIDWTGHEINVREDVAILHTGSIGAAVAPGDDVTLRLAQRAREHALVTFDPNVRPSLMLPRDEQLGRTERFMRASDVVKLSEEDAAWLYPDRSIDAVAHGILELGPRLVAITCGDKGSIVSSASMHRKFRSAAHHVADTIGAGDSYMAGLIHGITALVDECGLDAVRAGSVYSAETLDSLGRIASRCAAVTVGRLGADLPWHWELGTTW